MSIINDRYVIMSVSVTLVLLVFCFFPIQSDVNDDSVTISGIVYEVSETRKGYTFSLEDLSGTVHRCFSYIEPEDRAFYVLKGSTDSGNQMFFVSGFIDQSRDIYRTSPF